MKNEIWNGHKIRFVERMEMSGYVPAEKALAFVSVVERINTPTSSFLLTQNGEVLYQCDYYGKSDEIQFPNVIIPVERRISTSFNEAVCKWLSAVSRKNCFVTQHPSDYSTLAGKLAELVDYDEWLLSLSTCNTERRKGEKRTSGVYFVKADNGLIKIGCTSNIGNRLKSLQTSSPCALNLIAFVESNNQYALERKIHQRLSDRRVRGEWFDISDDTVNLMAANDSFDLGLSVSEQVYKKYS